MEENTIRTDRIKSISQRIWGKVENLNWIEIISIAIFGSVARQEDDSDSDIDLLVVAENIPEKRIERIPDMIKIKRELNLEFPLDVLLVSKHECRSNFRNHNPLYLDIAFDAEIIYDETNFLRDLIEETREYVKTHNIRRGDGSWSFPVKERAVTKL
jgi:predicted nucleotidyltransferase